VKLFFCLSSALNIYIGIFTFAEDQNPKESKGDAFSALTLFGPNSLSLTLFGPDVLFGNVHSPILQRPTLLDWLVGRFSFLTTRLLWVGRHLEDA
jgi:hypothetical protein